MLHPSRARPGLRLILRSNIVRRILLSKDEFTLEARGFKSEHSQLMTRPPSASFDSVPGYLDDAQRDHENCSKHRKRISPEPMTPPWNHPSRAKSPVKSTMKSSLQSPIPRLFAPDTSAVPPSSMASPSFKSVKNKSVKNLLGRKGSGTRKSPSADKVSRKWSLKVLF